MNPTTIKKVKGDVDPISQTMMDFQKSDPQMYTQLFAATSARFHQMNGSAPSSQVNKTGFVQYQNDMSDEFRNIVSQFTGKDGKVDRTKAAAMIKKYNTSGVRNDSDFKKTMNAFQQRYDVNPKYFDKSLPSAKNKLKHHVAGGFKIMGNTTTDQYFPDFPRKLEEEAKERFVRDGGTLPSGSTIKRIR